MAAGFLILYMVPGSILIPGFDCDSNEDMLVCLKIGFGTPAWVVSCLFPFKPSPGNVALSFVLERCPWAIVGGLVLSETTVQLPPCNTCVTLAL